MVIESDAAWDVNIRKLIQDLNWEFRRFLNDTGSEPLPNPRWKPYNTAVDLSGESEPLVTEASSLDDPWATDYWDVISLGQCHDNAKNRDLNHIYDDPFVPTAWKYYNQTLGRQRVIRRSGGFICTTGYAVSQTGAAKLLLRSAINLNDAVDEIIADMIEKDLLVAYSVIPPIIAQWKYQPNIGMESRNSDINGGGITGLVRAILPKYGWRTVRKSGSVWTLGSYFKDNYNFAEMALQGAWKQIFRASKVPF